MVHGVQHPFQFPCAFAEVAGVTLVLGFVDDWLAATNRIEQVPFLQSLCAACCNCFLVTGRLIAICQEIQKFTKFTESRYFNT